MLLELDFTDIKDSKDWDIASNPADDLIFLLEVITNSGTIQK
tara:strand:- start:189 stop:314 length:126 start_codon:yes stop_codon:yes gene_type:complete